MGGADAAYANVKDAYCKNGGLTAQSDCDQFGNQYITQAKAASVPKYAVEGGRSECCGGHNVNTRNGIYYIPSKTELAGTVSRLAAHEFVHTYQAMKGDYPPAWLMEGGAVQMQALVAHKFPIDVGIVIESYSKTYEYAGGRSKSIVDGTIAYYASTVGAAKGLTHAEDRCCGDSCGAGVKEADLPLDGAVYYDVGAMAIAFAINRANKTSAQFWTSPTLGEGFWNAIPVSNTWDYLNGHASQVKEGEGWKKAFTAFTGDANMAAFYAAFDAWAKAANKTTMLSILEKDADIVTMMAVKADISKSKSGGILETSKTGACAAPGAAGSPPVLKKNATGPAAAPAAAASGATRSAFSGALGAAACVLAAVFVTA